MQSSTLSLGIPKETWVGKIAKRLIRHRGSSRSLKASINVGYLSLIKCFNEYFGIEFFSFSCLAFYPL